MRVRVACLNQRRIALGAAAGPVAARVQPVHVLAVVVPNAKGQHHASSECLAHRRQGAEFSGAPVDSFTPCRVDGVPATASHGAGQSNVVLLVYPSDFAECAGSGTIVRDELSDHRERLACIQGAAGGPIILIALAIRIETTSAFVAVAGVVRARVWSEGGSYAVGLQDVHLVAAIP